MDHGAAIGMWTANRRSAHFQILQVRPRLGMIGKGAADISSQRIRWADRKGRGHALWRGKVGDMETDQFRRNGQGSFVFWKGWPS